MSYTLLIIQVSNSICHGLISPGDDAKYLTNEKNESFFLD